MAAARVAASASRGVRAPLRSSSGSGAARAALAVFPPAHAGGSGRLSWDSSPLRRLRSGSPVCRGLAAAGGEGCRPLAGAALGLRLPLGGFSFPGVSRPVKPRASLGFRPSESSPPGEPCRVAAAVASLRVRRDRSDRRGGGGRAAGLSPCACSSPGRPSTRGRTTDSDEGHGFRRPSEPPRVQRSLHDLRARRLPAEAPASKRCSPRESVLAASPARRARARLVRGRPRPFLSWAFAPPELAPP